MSSDSLREPRSSAPAAGGQVVANGGPDEETLVQDAAQIEHSLEISRRTEQPPAHVPGYTISMCLGEGAYGSVWLARENNTGKQVAVKFYTHRRGLDWSLLNREVEKLAVLYTSRHIVRLIDVGWDSDPPYYVMEYLDNGSLASFLADGPLPPHEAVRIAKSVLQALVHAHGSGILHCDLKPANVLLDSEFEARLCDFGQSRLSDEQKPALGTLFYMAPEQADMKAVPDARWDVYALGTLLYHMLCGEPPFRTPENEALIRSTESLEDRLAVYRRIVRQSPRPTQHRKTPGVDKRLAEIVDRCLQLNPDKRFSNAQAVLDALHVRDRQRSRRPIIALGVVGPAVLFLAMAPIIYKALQNAEGKARDSLTARALESDSQAAGILAGFVEREVRRRQLELVSVAEDANLRVALSKLEQSGWEDRTELVQILKRHKQGNDRKLKDLGLEKDASWFIDDAQGVQRWRDPFDEKTLDKDYSWRDYFHGQGFHYDPANFPEDIQPIQRRYISVPIRSQATGSYSVPVSVPIWSTEANLNNRRVIGVLALTASLGQLLTEYGENIRTENRLIALVDQRSGELLDHPWMTEENMKALLKGMAGSKAGGSARNSETAAGTPGKADSGSKPGANGLANLRLLDATLKQIDPGAGGSAGVIVRDASYRDPISRLDPKNYGGEWLAAFAPVGNTGWTVIVQERKATALRPVGELRSETIRYGVIALIVSGSLIGVLWYFVLRAINDRVLRVGQWRSDGHRTESGTGLSTVSSQR